jgi:hypothetical protein
MAETEHAMQSVEDLLRKSLEGFGERECAEKQRTAMSTIWETYIA